MMKVPKVMAIQQIAAGKDQNLLKKKDEKRGKGKEKDVLKNGNGSPCHMKAVGGLKYKR